MCGKFTQGFDLSYLTALLKLPPTSARPAGSATPGRTALALRSGVGQIMASTLRWGFASAPGLGVRPIINARAETMADKPMFASACRQARCALPVSAYLEGNTRLDLPDIPLFYLAGLFQNGADGMAEFCVITREATPALASIHPRMPLVLHDRVTLKGWLDAGVQPEQPPRLAVNPFDDAPRQLAMF